MIRKWILWALFACFAAFCIIWLTQLVVDAVKSDSTRRMVKELRAERAAQATGPIYIGAAGDWKSQHKNLLDGINLAADEINAAGGVLGRPIKIVVKDDGGSVATGMEVAQEFAENIDVVAVIGHTATAVANVTPIIYEYDGLLLLSPLSSHPNLTKKENQLFFRKIPTELQWGKQLAEFAAYKGFKRIAIYCFQDDYFRRLSNAFEKSSAELGLTIVDRLPYDATYVAATFKSDFNVWKNQFKPDAILLLGHFPLAAECAIQMRTAGFDIPIISSRDLDNDDFITRAGKKAENTYVASLFDTRLDRPEVITFNNAFKAKYGYLPHQYAAQGYDSMKLLAHVIQVSGSTVPAKMAETLRSVKNWQGVTGLHTFDKFGDVSGKKLFMKVVKNGRFELVEMPKGVATGL